MRLIDADALIEEKSWDADTRIGYVQVVDVGDILDAPTIEPERKRGKWEITNLGAVGAFDSCSECKRVVKHKAPFYNYCPNCGADMRGEQDEIDNCYQSD